MSIQVKKVLFIVVAILGFISLELFGGTTGKGIQALIGTFSTGWLISDVSNSLFRN